MSERITIDDLRGHLEWNGSVRNMIGDFEPHEMPIELEHAWSRLQAAYEDLEMYEDEIYRTVYA